MTAPENLRFDACATVDAPFTGDGEVAYQPLEGSTFAVITFVGPMRQLPEVYRVLGQALTKLRGYRIIGLPAVEIYRVTDINPDCELTQTEIMIPVAQLGS